MLAALVTALSACVSGAGPEAYLEDPPSMSVEIEPAALELAPGDSHQFTAAVSGTEVVEVTWSVVESNGGTVSDAGIYTAAAVPGTYHVVATSTFDAAKSTSAVVTVTSRRRRLLPPQSGSERQAGLLRGAYLTGVTGGGGMMPSWTANVVTASCAGNGTTDDTSCLQAAANAARDQGKALVIPAKAPFYKKISGPVKIYGSVGGVGGTPR